MSSFLHQLLSKLSPQRREPAPTEVLQAHLAALLERYVPSEPDSLEPNKQLEDKVRLSVVQPKPPLVLRVETGLSRVEVSALSAERVQVRVLGDHFLVPPAPNASALRSLLSTEGFVRPRHASHYQAEFDAPSPGARRRVAQRIEVLLTELLGHRADSPYSVSIELDAPPDNEHLVQSMRTLARQRDFESRRIVYQHIINGWFYLPVNAEEETFEPPTVYKWPHEFDGKDVWAMFTSVSDLCSFRPSPEPYVLISGIRVVQAAVASEVGALKLNPRSRIGGELYGHEIETLADYLKKIGVSAAT